MSAQIRVCFKVYKIRKWDNSMITHHLHEIAPFSLFCSSISGRKSIKSPECQPKSWRATWFFELSPFQIISPSKIQNPSLCWYHSQGLQALSMLGTGIRPLSLLCCQRNLVEGAIAPLELLHGRGEMCHAACVGCQTVAQAQPGREHKF